VNAPAPALASGSAGPRCPDCGSARLRSLGALPDVAYFAGRRLAAPLAGGALMQCRDCDLRFRHPALAGAAYAALYDNAELGAWAAGPLRKDQRLVQEVVQEVVEGVARTGAGPARVLDFGCYTGDFLAALPSALHKAGVEVNAAAAAVAARRSGARVVAALDALPPAMRFDVIVAMDVIEHVPSPQALLTQLLDRLASGGSLVITTGDGGNALWRLLGARWWYCYYPEHIAFVSARWLAYHVPRMGARVRRVERFNYLERTRPGALDRWRALVKYLLRPGRHAARRARALAEEGRDPGVPGIGLTRDHLRVVLTK
jgi:SAM-dependent methyltransferase